MKYLQLITSTIGIIIGFLIGDINPLLIALLCFICIDYITGILKGAIKKNLNSEICFRGLFKKAIILIVVIVANVLDVYVINSNVAKSVTIMFYIMQESISIIENVGACGVPIPEKLKKIIYELNDKEYRRRKDD